ncbi:P-loop containing nucleoside triphosphate hydrolase protein [Blyttiomyces helicus]|uniref:P-loop containing nucleoside triphosphate hydrolase protein n=1 Tax=Blyttiomyces helicus TaxID=388810 RepID=A0A4P9VUL1_9FUNG|nr:P-loop containing nucleoside triphosphate hydrolase protein [Blyttiomyces helicus]|eukprot:RKO83284.1 P-loop containing nucleoside triphosphate hydrolase protein [Blyttiomyces helicus]
MIMRRLRRLCAFHDNFHVQFISCSATIADPARHMQTFFGLDETAVHVVADDGAPCGEKHHVVWNPPLKDARRGDLGRISTVVETVRLVVYLMGRGVRVICFAKVRRMCEILLKETQTALREAAPDLVDRVMSYRGGYTAQDRRRIEGQLFRGELLCVVATNALELGVDIGSLDAVIHMSFPFTLASYRQQSGRAGRRERDSVSILVAEGENRADQHYAENPSALYDAPLESPHLDLTTATVVEAHLQCAAAEVPLDRESADLFGDGAWDLCREFLSWDKATQLFFPHRKYEGRPSKSVQIRSIDEESYRVVDVTTHQDIEDIEASRAPFTLYEVNAERLYAKVRPTNVDFVTVPRDFTDVDPARTIESRVVRATKGGGTVETEVKTTVFGYFKMNPRTKQLFGATTDLEMPSIVKERFGFWIDGWFVDLIGLGT